MAYPVQRAQGNATAALRPTRLAPPTWAEGGGGLGGARGSAGGESQEPLSAPPLHNSGETATCATCRGVRPRPQQS